MEDEHKEPKQEQEGEPTDQRKEEEAEAAKLEEQTDQRKDKSEELTDQRKVETERSSEEESMEDSSPLVHPCSQLLQFVARACAWCLGMPDSLDDDGGATRPAASLNSSREISLAAVNKTSGSTGFNMQERFSGVLVQLRRLQPGTNNPREGRGGEGGVHH